MGFFDRNRKALEEKGIDPSRLPPGQYLTDRFPVLHVGSVPSYPKLADFTLAIGGLVEDEVELSWGQIVGLPATEVVVDIHCVTKWSKFDTTWKGVAFSELMKLVTVKSGATHILGHGEHGYTANIPLEDCIGDDDKGQPKAMIAYEFGGHPLDPEHGYPLRFLLPRLYLWKSTKWLRGLEFLSSDRAGYWERNGYHMYGDPFREQRFTND